MDNSLESTVAFTRRDILSIHADAFVNFIDYKGSVMRQAVYANSIANSMSKTLLSKMEKYCRRKTRACAFIPSFIIGKKPGNFIISSSFGLNCYEIIHVVSAFAARYMIREKTAIIFLNSVFKYCCSKQYKTVVISLFTIRDHEFEKDYTYDLIRKVASVYSELRVIIVE